MTTEYQRLQEEIIGITGLTKAGALHWEKYPGLFSVYQTTKEPQIIVSCGKHGCYMQTKYGYSDIDCEDLKPLCDEITKQIQQTAIQLSALVDTLQIVNRNAICPTNTRCSR